MIHRNAVYNAQGGINLEVDHPVHGWVPFTASPDDPEEFGRNLFEIAASGEVLPFVAPIISTDPDDYPLNKQQWDWLLAVSGLDDALDSVLAVEKASNRVAYANLKRLLGGNEFHFAAVLTLIAQYAANIPAEIDTSETTIAVVWMQAKDV